MALHKEQVLQCLDCLKHTPFKEMACKCRTPGPSTSQGAGPNVASKTLVAKEAKRARGSMHHEIFIDASKLTGRTELRLEPFSPCCRSKFHESIWINHIQSGQFLLPFKENFPWEPESWAGLRSGSLGFWRSGCLFSSCFTKCFETAGSSIVPSEFEIIWEHLSRMHLDEGERAGGAVESLEQFSISFAARVSASHSKCVRHKYNQESTRCNVHEPYFFGTLCGCKRCKCR